MIETPHARKKLFAGTGSACPGGIRQWILVAACLIMACTGCRPEPDVLEVDFDAAEFAAFVEPDFPFITTSIDARALGSRFPSGNAAVRCLALQLGNDTYACFDTDLLRIAAVWKGGFVSMTGMAQISYNEYGRRNNEIPHILGTPLFGVGCMPAG